MESRQKAKPTKVWHTIGYATIGPEMIGDNTNRKKPGVTSGPEVNDEVRVYMLSYVSSAMSIYKKASSLETVCLLGMSDKVFLNSFTLFT